MSLRSALVNRFDALVARAIFRNGQRLFSRQVAEGRLKIGRHSYGEPVVVAARDSTVRVTIGNFCSIADGVTFLCSGDHRPDWVTTFPFRLRLGLPGAGADGHPRHKGDIVVGHDVWIGRDVMILEGVHIGHGAVVAARSLVTRDVAPYSIVAGTPARELRPRFPPGIVADLLAVEWWHWDDRTILERIPELCSTEVEAFARRYRKGSAEATRSTA